MKWTASRAAITRGRVSWSSLWKVSGLGHGRWSQSLLALETSIGGEEKSRLEANADRVYIVVSLAELDR